MEEKWNECLAMIREQVADTHQYDVWFSGITFESYDAREHVVTLAVPSRYVFEYLEQHCTDLLSSAIAAAFGPGTRLAYRVLREPTFADVATYLQQHGYDSRKDPFHVAIPNARRRMEDGLRYFLGDKAKWVQGYDRVAEWLTDNKGRGLLCFGTTGMGKTLLCTRILPVILGNGGRKIPIVYATDLKSRYGELRNERILIIDDLGKEPRRHFGETDNTFFELCNNAERTGSLLVITTNLSTTPCDDPRYPDSILHRYGPEVLDRLKAITKTARLEGESMRM